MSENNDIVKMWQQMGASTGSMIGQFIGLSAQMTLDVFNNNFVNPAKSLSNDQTGIRSQTWGQMGQQFGNSFGQLVGSSFDTFIKTFENTVIQPLQQMEESTNQQSGQSNQNNQ